MELIRQARADMFVQPNESDHKIYQFPRAQDMGIPGQNALLKVLEEPPSYGVFILIADNPDKLLPTVRSRCTELKLQALPADILEAQLQKDFPKASQEDIAAAASRSGGFLGQAKALLENGEGALSETLKQWLDLLENALMSRSGADTVSPLARELARKRTAPALYGGIQALRKALEYTMSNVSPAAVCGWLSWELRKR